MVLVVVLYVVQISLMKTEGVQLTYSPCPLLPYPLLVHPLAPGVACGDGAGCDTAIPASPVIFLKELVGALVGTPSSCIRISVKRKIPSG